LYFEFLLFSIASVLRELASQPNLNLRIYIYSQDVKLIEKEVRLNPQFRSELISFFKIEPDKYNFNNRLTPVSNIVVKQFESFTCHARFFILKELLETQPDFNILYMDDDACIAYGAGQRIVNKLSNTGVTECMTSNFEYNNKIRDWFVSEYQRLTSVSDIESKVRTNFSAMIAIKYGKQYEEQYDKTVLNNGIMYCPNNPKSLELITECIELYRDLHTNFHPFIYNDQLAVSIVYHKHGHIKTMFNDNELNGVYHFYCEKYLFPDEMRKLFTIVYKNRLTNKTIPIEQLEPQIQIIEKVFPTFRMLFISCDNRF